LIFDLKKRNNGAPGIAVARRCCSIENPKSKIENGVA
jgi:hypothetical protein